MIRQLDVSDRDAVWELLVACGQSWSCDDVARQLVRDGAINLGLADGVGVILGWQVADVAEIAMVAVSPKHRQQGHGKALVRAFQQASSADKVWLEVRRSNTGAQALYGAMGFVVVGTRPRYYRDGEDAVLMDWIRP